MKEAKKVTIDEHEYTFGHWPVDKASEIWAWILETFGPGFKAVYEQIKDTQAEAFQNMNELEMGVVFLDTVLANIQSKMNPKDYSAKLKEICGSDILCDGKPISYNTHFMGRIFHLHRVAAEVLKFQYQDFLDAALES